MRPLCHAFCVSGVGQRSNRDTSEYKGVKRGLFGSPSTSRNIRLQVWATGLSKGLQVFETQMLPSAAKTITAASSGMCLKLARAGLPCVLPFSLDSSQASLLF